MTNDTLVIPAGVIMPGDLLLWLDEKRRAYRGAAKWITGVDLGSDYHADKAVETALLYDHLALAYDEVIAHLTKDAHG